MEPLRFFVQGSPAPKGSGRAVKNARTGKAVYLPGSSAKGGKRIKAFTQAVTLGARAAMAEREPWARGVPLVAEFIFYLARPRSHYTKGGTLKPSAPEFPTVKPDASKLLRCGEDALSGVVMHDDAQFTDVVSRKRYAAGADTGARVTVWEMR